MNEIVTQLSLSSSPKNGIWTKNPQENFFPPIFPAIYDVFGGKKINNWRADLLHILNREFRGRALLG